MCLFIKIVSLILLCDLVICDQGSEANRTKNSINTPSATVSLPNSNNSNNFSVGGTGNPVYRNPYYPPSHNIPTPSNDVHVIKTRANPIQIPRARFQRPVSAQPLYPPAKQIQLLLLDVNYRETTPGVVLYETLAPNVHKFSAYEPYYIKVVSYGDDVLWEAQTTKYPTGVIYDESTDQPKLELLFSEAEPIKPPPQAAPPPPAPPVQAAPTPMSRTDLINRIHLARQATQQPERPPLINEEELEYVDRLDFNVDDLPPDFPPPMNINSKLRILTQDPKQPGPGVQLPRPTLKPTSPDTTSPLNQHRDPVPGPDKQAKQPSGVIVGGAVSKYGDGVSVDILAMMKQIALMQKQINSLQKRLDDLEHVSKENTELKRENDSLKTQLKTKSAPRSSSAPEPRTSFWDSLTDTGGGFPRPKKPITLYVDCRDCNLYEVNCVGHDWVFTCNLGYMFEKVVAGSKVLWRAVNGNYAKQVIVSKRDEIPKVKYVTFVGKNTKF